MFRMQISHPKNNVPPPTPTHIKMWCWRYKPTSATILRMVPMPLPYLPCLVCIRMHSGICLCNWRIFVLFTYVRANARVRSCVCGFDGGRWEWIASECLRSGWVVIVVCMFAMTTHQQIHQTKWYTNLSERNVTLLVRVVVANQIHMCFITLCTRVRVYVYVCVCVPSALTSTNIDWRKCWRQSRSLVCANWPLLEGNKGTNEAAMDIHICCILCQQNERWARMLTQF